MVSQQLKYGCFLALIVVSTVLMAGCKKDSSNNSNTNTGNALFSGTWKLSKFEIKASDSTWVQTTAPALLTDNDYVFNSDGTFTLTSGGLKSGSGSWSAYDNGKTIQIGSTSFHINVETSTELQFEDDVETFAYTVNGTTATYYGERDTYTH